jgi:ankyrin repeat protein
LIISIIQALDRQQMRPLHGASFYGSIDTTRLLIEHGADILAIDKTKSIPFAYACRNSHYNILYTFFTDFSRHPKAKEVIKAVDIENNTLLHVAVASANAQIVRLLLEQHADPSAKRDGGQTPVHLCAKTDSVEILEQLVVKGGDISEIDDQNETILHKAAAHNKEQVLRFALLKKVEDLSRISI